MEGVPLELIEKSTTAQQAVMLKIVEQREKDRMDGITYAVWNIFSKK